MSSRNPFLFSRSLLKNSSRLSFRGALGDEESRISFSFRARFLRLASLGVGMTRFRKVFQQTARRKVNVAYSCMLQSPTIGFRNRLTQRSWHATLASDCVVEELWHYRGYRQTSQFWRSLGPQPNRRPRRPLCREGSQHRVHGDSVASVLKAFGPRGHGEVRAAFKHQTKIFAAREESGR